MKEQEPRPGGFLYCGYHRKLIGMGDARSLRGLYTYHLQTSKCSGEIYLLHSLPVNQTPEEIIKGGELYNK